MNDALFNFEEKQPPVLTEKMLREEIERRKLIRQIRLLKISSLLVALCLALFSFFIMNDSIIISFFCIALLFVYLSGYAIVSALFFKKGYGLNQ